MSPPILLLKGKWVVPKKAGHVLNAIRCVFAFQFLSRHRRFRDSSIVDEEKALPNHGWEIESKIIGEQLSLIYLYFGGNRTGRVGI